ncbi:MAG: hypothetical protein IPK83_19745 [Planctomycetes bacterium]|nr:hypothetical protein [Planctomycetota bacterium]
MHVHDLTQNEIAAKGRELYEQRIRATVEANHHGQIIDIDVKTGDYEIDDEHLEAARRLKLRSPDALLFAIKIGFPAFARIGGRLRIQST